VAVTLQQNVSHRDPEGRRERQRVHDDEFVIAAYARTPTSVNLKT
jgi:hypothetical protein